MHGEGIIMAAAHRQYLAAELKRMREALGEPGDAVASQLGPRWSQSKISRIETGRISVSVSDLSDLLAYYGAPDDVRAELLTRTAADIGAAGTWVVQAGSAPRRQAEVAAIETKLRRFSQFQAAVVPGQLQSPGYTAEVVARGGFPHPEIVATRRIARQALLVGHDAPEYKVVVEARAFLTCSSGELPGLVSHIEARAKLPRIDFRLIPLESEAGSVAMTSFIKYEFADHDSPPVILVEGQTADFYLASEADISTYTSLFGRLRSQALDCLESLVYLRSLVRRIEDLRSSAPQREGQGQL